MSSVQNAPDDREAGDWIARPDADTERRYRAALRHSILVRLLRVALPVASILAIVGGAVYFYILPALPPSIAAASVDVTHNAIIMQDPHVSGFMSGGRSYELKADRAEQSLANTKVVTLQNISATIGMGHDDTAKVAAVAGTYYSDAERIVLDKGITLSTTTGLDGLLQSADIDLKNGTMRSDQPIEFRSEGSTLKANAIEVRDRGQRILFRNGVKLTYTLPLESSPAAKSAAPSSVTE